MTLTPTRASRSWAIPLALAAVTIARAASAAPSCPPEMARVGASCVDRYEASLVEVLPDGTEIPYSPYLAPNGHRVRAVSAPDVVPQAHASMADAWLACRAAKKHLCRPEEWVAACKGPGGTRYPYGQARVEFACVDTGRTRALQELYSAPAMYENANMNDPRINQTKNTVARTGEASRCTNAYGVFDMVGNLNEWVDDTTIRGGFYLDSSLLGEGCDYATRAHSKVYYDYSTGFRCCALPEERDELDAASTVFAALAALRPRALVEATLALSTTAHATARR